MEAPNTGHEAASTRWGSSQLTGAGGQRPRAACQRVPAAKSEGRNMNTFAAALQRPTRAASAKRVNELRDPPERYVPTAAQTVRRRPSIGQVIGAEQAVPHGCVHRKVLVQRFTL